MVFKWCWLVNKMIIIIFVLQMSLASSLTCYYIIKRFINVPLLYLSNSKVLLRKVQGLQWLVCSYTKTEYY